MLSSYLKQVDKAVDQTPPERNRVVDLWRVIALIVVVFGHWLAASIWVRPDGEVIVGNTLEWIPNADYATWIVQVMPIFFFVGGYANARALRRHTNNRRTWITLRFRRLFTPAVPVIIVWTVLALVLRNFIDADLVYAGVLNATIPLWFLAVYLTLIGIAPFTFRWWNRIGLWSVIALVAGAVVVDVLYRAFDVPGVGWMNLVFVWGAIHQLGYWWADREDTTDVLTPIRAALLTIASLASLVIVTSLDWYPVAMITIPGGGPQNVTPPTSAMILLGVTQIGIILATLAPAARASAKRRTWRFVVGVSGFMMTIYVWHLTALSLVIAGGLFTFSGAAFSLEPGTALWWMTRPLFYAVLVAAVGILILLFGRFEHDINTKPTTWPVPVLVLGMTLTVVALGATAFVYLVDRDANLTWWIPAVTIVAALVMQAYPSSWSRTPRSDTPQEP